MILTCKRWTALRASAAGLKTVTKIVADAEVAPVLSEMRAMCSMPAPRLVKEKAELVDAFFIMCPTKRITVRSVE